MTHLNQSVSSRDDSRAVQLKNDELAERMAIIELLAGHIADSACGDCLGEGLDYEGAEWTLCECVLEKVQ